ncbi:MAG: hypothetical protein QM680_03745 [Luteolibacter sp.]
MKLHLLTPLAIASLLASTACRKKSVAAAPAPTPERPETQSDIPLLPIKPGAEWNYQVTIEIPADIPQPGNPAQSLKTTRTRTYLGKTSPGEGFPTTDCFEVTTPNSPKENEFVEIHDDKILLRGGLVRKTDDAKPLWYEKPLPFVKAGIKAGDQLREFNLGTDHRTRKIDIIGRESITVPAGTYSAIRMLMSGKDGDFELRRTIWFSPGNGIIREEKIRYHKDQLILRETQELTSTNVPKRP